MPRIKGKWVKATEPYPWYFRKLVNWRVGKAAVITHIPSQNHFVVRCGTLYCVVDEDLVLGPQYRDSWQRTWPALDELRKKVGRQYD